MNYSVYLLISIIKKLLITYKDNHGTKFKINIDIWIKYLFPLLII